MAPEVSVLKRRTEVTLLRIDNPRPTLQDEIFFAVHHIMTSHNRGSSVDLGKKLLETQKIPSINWKMITK